MAEQIAALKDEDWAIREEAAGLLGTFKDPRAVLPLVSILRDRDRAVREAAIGALTSIGAPSVEALGACLVDRELSVQEAASGICLALLNATALAAQAPSLVGSWQISYPAGVRNENGNVTVLHGTGVLTIVTQGDSLVGSLAADPNPEFTPRPAARLAGKSTAGEATLISHSEATLSMNGEERTATVLSTWRFRVQGDSLQGTVERKLEGIDIEDGSQPPQPVTGVRRKG